MRFNPTLLGFIIKEIRQTLRDPRMRVVLFVAPVFQLTIFGVALSNETRNVRLAAVFAPSDSVASTVYQRSLASRWFIPAKTTGNDPFLWIESGEAEAVIIAPNGSLSKAVARGEGELQLLINAKNAVRAQSIESYMRGIIAKEVLPAASGPNTVAPVRFDVRPLYNPTLETSVYMVPGVMCMLACVTTILLTGMSVARERELGTLETLIAAPVRAWEVILGKTVPFVILGMVQLPLILTAAVVLFGIPVEGPLIMFFVAAFFFVLSSVAVGIFISTLAKNQQQAMLGGFLFLFPSVLLSGLMFPLENMPFVMRMVAKMNPLTHFISLLRNILLKGGSFDFFLKHVAILLVLAVLINGLALFRFRTRL